MRPQHRRRALAALAAVTLVGTTACSAGDAAEKDPAEPAPVALSPGGVPEDLTLGVLVSLSSATGQGSQWREAAEGAQVAAYRYGLGDVDVTLVPADDRGTSRVRSRRWTGWSAEVSAASCSPPRAATSTRPSRPRPTRRPRADAVRRPRRGGPA